MRNGERLVGAGMALAATAGCLPAEGHQPPVPEQTPSLAQVTLECPGDTPDVRQAILSGLQPGQRIRVVNLVTESVVQIDTREANQFAVWGANPRQYQDGDVVAASGNPYEEWTVMRVVAGEPEFIGYDPVWRNAGSAITAFCAEHTLRSPDGYFVPIGGAILDRG